MSYRVDTTPNFEREAKRLIKKYRSLNNEIYTLIESLENEPKQGTHIGDNIYKIRLISLVRGLTTSSRSSSERTCISRPLAPMDG